MSLCCDYCHCLRGVGGHDLIQDSRSDVSFCFCKSKRQVMYDLKGTVAAMKQLHPPELLVSHRETCVLFGAPESFHSSERFH